MRREHQMTWTNRHSRACRGAPDMEKTDRTGDDGAAIGDRLFAGTTSCCGVSSPWPRAPVWSDALALRALALRLSMILTCALLLLWAPWSTSADSLRTGSLAADARNATSKNLPILLFFTQPGCAYCERARREYLRPLAESGAWSARTLIREVAIEATIAGIDGRAITGRDLARSYGIRVFPTVIFIDGNGRQIAEPVAGFTVPDFYAAYLEQRLEAAITRLTKT